MHVWLAEVRVAMGQLLALQHCAGHCASGAAAPDEGEEGGGLWALGPFIEPVLKRFRTRAPPCTKRAPSRRASYLCIVAAVRGWQVLKRFRFHFEGRRETNRRDKPEWVFSHCSTLLRTHAPFLSTVVQACPY